MKQVFECEVEFYPIADHPKNRPSIRPICQSSKSLTIHHIVFDLYQAESQYYAHKTTNKVSGSQGLKMKEEITGCFTIGNRITLKDLQMTSTIIGIIITAIAIESDKITQYQYYGFPLVAVVGILMVIISLAAD